MGALNQEPDLAYQRGVLPDVSRTFALTIPELPADLELAVGNAYLLCRIADTIEDDPALDEDLRKHLHEELIAVLADEGCAAAFAERCCRHLSDATSTRERELVADTPRVLAIHRGLSPAQRKAIRTCVLKMCKGMPEYQHEGKARGLANLEELDRYCYHVAGVVGELLTELFCEHSAAIEAQRQRLHDLSASFGQGLQMTNIIKDVWDDHARGYCWLPRDMFAAAGYDLDQLAPDHDRARFRVGLEQLIAIAHGHLQNAMRYTLLIPAAETGIRRFCLWAVGLALLTLRKVRAHPDYVSPQDVKVSRRAVAAVVTATRLSVRSDRLLRMLFRFAASGLPDWPVATPVLAVDAGASRASR
ncbi:MAG: squalene/phytoene synthase family protein [Gammaproteobacteria bacterium]|nr:squalene/phytoene synthase family protein [Gammaproteobacteria bacterium]